MKNFFFLLCLIFITMPVWGQQQFNGDDQYPETAPSVLEGNEIANSRNLPESDYEEVPREEQQYAPSAEPPTSVTEDSPAPEEIYEADEAYLE